MPLKHDIAWSESPSQIILPSQVEYPQQTELSQLTKTDVSPQAITPRLPQRVYLSLPSKCPQHRTDHRPQQISNRQLQTNLSPLIALPLEMKQHIFSYLKGPEPTLIVLRRTHPHFRHIIPKRNHRKELHYADERAYLIAADKLAADDKQPKLFLPNHLACFTCLEVMPSEKFSDRNTYKARRVGGKDAHKRFCLDCGLRDQKYTESQTLYINRVHHVVMRPIWRAKYKFVEQRGNVSVESLGYGPEFRFVEYVEGSLVPIDGFKALS